MLFASVLHGGAARAEPPGSEGAGALRGAPGGPGTAGTGAPGSGRVSPASFGKVFRANRRALVRVRGLPDGRWATGFLVGARGEVLFSAPEVTAPALEVLTHDGRRHAAELLGRDAGLALAVARVREVSEAGFVPLRVAEAEGLERDRWVVILSHDAEGKPQPHAGVVAQAGNDRRLPGVPVALVDVPGQPGSPVLSPEGTLLGISRDGGRRRTQVVAFSAVLPFAKAVVLGATD